MGRGFPTVLAFCFYCESSGRWTSSGREKGVGNYPSWLLIRSCPVSYAAVLYVVTQCSSLQAEGEGRRRVERDDTKNGCV